MSHNHVRSTNSEAKKLQMRLDIGDRLEELGLSVTQTQRLLPTFSRREILELRQANIGTFGYERLLYVLERLGMEPDVTWRKTPRRGFKIPDRYAA